MITNSEEILALEKIRSTAPQADKVVLYRRNKFSRIGFARIWFKFGSSVGCYKYFCKSNVRVSLFDVLRSLWRNLSKNWFSFEALRLNSNWLLDDDDVFLSTLDNSMYELINNVCAYSWSLSFSIHETLKHGWIAADKISSFYFHRKTSLQNRIDFSNQSNRFIHNCTVLKTVKSLFHIFFKTGFYNIKSRKHIALHVYHLAKYLRHLLLAEEQMCSPLIFSIHYSIIDVNFSFSSRHFF